MLVDDFAQPPPLWLWVPAFAGTTLSPDMALHPAARIAPGVLQEHCPPKNEGAGNTGCTLHPRSRVQVCAFKNAHEHTGSAEAIRHSLRNGFNGLFRALPGVPGLIATVARASLSCELDASVGASGPHVLAVRMQNALVSCAACVHRISPRVCDDHDTPLGGVRRRGI
jgi:hypothetical protein